MLTRKPPDPAAEHTHRFAIGEVTVAVRSNEPALLHDFAELYDSCRIDGAAGRRPIHIEVRRVRASRFGRRTIEILGDGELLSKITNADEVLPHLERGIDRRVIATRSEFVQLQAATLVSEGRGVILVGPTGAGKSTLAAGLIARGWRSLSDELALVHARTGLLHPFPKAVCVTSGSMPVTRKLGLSPGKGELGYIRPADVDDDHLEPAPVAMIVMPRYTGHDTVRVQELAPAQATFRLASNMLNRGAYGARAVPVLARLARSAPCHTLESGPLDEACDAIERFMRG
ncbi:MAG: hypothetical protein ACYTGP_12105 [Planctomycetota bacterium]|jgi:HprK-related kinase A